MSINTYDKFRKMISNMEMQIQNYELISHALLYESDGTCKLCELQALRLLSECGF